MIQEIQNTPRHIAFLMDGNRRWAKKRGKAAPFGHREGAKRVYELIQACSRAGIPYVTFWGLSTENLKERSGLELNAIFSLFKKAVALMYDLNTKGFGLRFQWIGNRSGLPFAVRHVFEECERKTKANDGTTVIGAANYGGRDEMLRAVRKMIAAKELVSEKTFSQCLDTRGIPDPDVVVRTGGRSRLSGFMPWQSVYAELYFTDVLWPDFDEKELTKAIGWFSKTQRNFGK